MSKLTDNKLEQIEVTISPTTTLTPVSIQIALDIPIGFAAKIESVEFYYDWSHRVIEVSDANESIQMALLNDPDDEDTIAFPDNERSHDVIARYELNMTWVQNIVIKGVETERKIEFGEDEDVYATRNLRFNAMFTGTTAPGADEAQCLIGFRFEKLTVSDAKNILGVS